MNVIGHGRSKTTFVGQRGSIFQGSQTQQQLTPRWGGRRERWTRAVEGTWYRGMTFTPEVSSIERYLTIPLDFFPALYSINALVGVAEGADEDGGNMAHFMGSGQGRILLKKIQ